MGREVGRGFRRMPGKSHGQRSLVGYSPQGRKELDTTEQLHFLTFTHLIPLYNDWSTEKLQTSISPKLPFNRKSCNHFQMYIRISLKFFEKYKCPSIAFFFFFGQRFRYVSNEQSCLKITGLYEDLLLLSSLFSISYSMLPFHLVLFSNLFISFFLCSFSSLYQVLQKSFCIHTYK